MHKNMNKFFLELKPTYKIITEGKNLVLRRKPPGKLLPSAHAVDREYKVITALYGMKMLPGPHFL